MRNHQERQGIQMELAPTLILDMFGHILKLNGDISQSVEICINIEPAVAIKYSRFTLGYHTVEIINQMDGGTGHLDLCK